MTETQQPPDQDVDGSSEPWTSWHVGVHGTGDTADVLVVKAFAAVLPSAVAAGSAQRWFFLRHWEGGPHLRVRVQGAGPGVLDDLRAAIEQVFGEQPAGTSSLDPATFYGGYQGGAEAARSLPWRADRSITEVPYEPEVARYGGPAGLEVSEDLFTRSSEVAAAVVGAVPDPSARAAVALDLLHVFCDAAGLDDLEGARFLRRYVAQWRLPGPDRPVLDLARLRAAAERDFHAAPQQFAQRRAQVCAQARAAEQPLWAHWRTVVSEAAQRYRDLEDEGRLAVPLVAVLSSQLHMLHNRLAVDIGQECHLAWLAALATIHPSEPVAYFADGPHAPDRVLHAVSALRETAAEEQQPVDLPRTDARPPRWPGQLVVDLPSPTNAPGATATLVEVLATRRSGYGRYHGPLSATDLAAVLARSVGGVRTVPAGAPGRRTTMQVRQVPSAGALYSTSVHVGVVDVDGVPPGGYAYDPVEHQLLSTGPAPDLPTLLSSSPFLDPEGPQPVIGDEAPAWLFVVGDLGLLRSRYGVRGYRLALAEAGHAGQNIALAATAGGLSTVTIGGFHDDAVSLLLGLDGIDQVPLYVMPLGRLDDEATNAKEKP